ncbi:diaminopimelate decarboxylase, partial [Salmonella enterica]|nr:diaminopimelate decarboxylase [Salmonella enterica]
RAGFPAKRIGLHGNNKSVAEIRQALDFGVGRIVVDSFEEIERIAAVAAELGVRAPVMVRVTVGVEAHTHEFIATAHEDQKFGFSLAGGRAAEAVARILGHADTLDLLGLHSHIGSQIFDTSGFEVSARRLIGLHAEVARVHGVHMPELDLGG